MSDIRVLNVLSGGNPDQGLVNWFQRRSSSKSRYLTRSEEKVLLDTILEKIHLKDYKYLGDIQGGMYLNHCHLIHVTIDNGSIDLKISDWQIDMISSGEFAQISSDVPCILRHIAPIKKRINEIYQVIDSQNKTPFPKRAEVPKDINSSDDKRILQFPRP